MQITFTRPRRAITVILSALVALFLMVGLSACSELDSLLKEGAKGAGVGSSAPSTAWVNEPLRINDARNALSRLKVAPKGTKNGYTRDQFGTAWTDNQNAPGGNNGCATRDDILARDLSKVVTKGCVVQSGVLTDPYTGKTINFTRGKQSAVVQIDHLVALGNAWVSGAPRLSVAKRTELANDPLNLAAADGPTNGAKGDKDASEWLPPNAAVAKRYAIAQILVKDKYGLTVTAAEKAKLTELVSK